MPADNSHTCVAAARRRAERTPAAARSPRCDAWTPPATRSPSTPSPAKPASPAPGSTPSTTCEPRSNGSATGTASAPQPPRPPERQRASDASLLRRLQAATDRIQRLEDDNRQLRDALAAALGQRRTAAILGQRPGHDTPEIPTTRK